MASFFLIDIVELDVNECDDISINQCEHSCVDTITGYYCECNSGYTLTTNRKTCRGLLSKLFLRRLPFSLSLMRLMNNDDAVLCLKGCCKWHIT